MTARDNLALYAMQVLLKERSKTHINLWNRIKRMLGFSYYTTSGSINSDKIARMSYAIADKMLEVSEEE